MQLSRKSAKIFSPTRVLGMAYMAAIVWGGSAVTLPAAEAPSAELLQLIADLVGDADKEMRAIGLQQVRSEAPGEAATRQFIQWLPKLRPEACAELVEALGERGDPAARPAVLDVLQSPDEATRAAALRALAKLGSESDVPLLAQRIATGSAAEQLAASQSLTRLKGEGVNRAIVAQLGPAPSGIRVQLLGILAARNATESLPAVVASASESDAVVRLAALDALRVLAEEGQTGDLVKLLQTAETDAHRTKAEAALLALCTRVRGKCVPALTAGLAGADARTRAMLLQALARSGGSAALEAVASCLEDPEPSVRDEAVRMLSLWPDRDVVPRLEKIASAEDLRHHVLAVRGLVRLASPEGDQPADLKLLEGAIRLAKRRDEKLLALGVLSRAASAPSLALAVALLDDPAITEDAGWTAGVIAESLAAGNQETVRSAMRRVLDRTQSPKARDQAQKVLNAL